MKQSLSRSDRHLTRNQRILIGVAAAAMFAAGLYAAQTALEANMVNRKLALIVALLPAVPMTWFWYEYLAGLRRLDEMQRAIEIRALAYGAGGVLWLALAWGLAEELAGAPRFPVVFIAPAGAGAYGLARVILSRSYR